MVKLALYMSLMLILCAGIARAALEQSSVDWFKNLDHAKQKLTHLHFFFHDNVSGKNATVVRIAQPINAFKPPTFGRLNMVDNLLTEGPNPTTSKPVGRAQGLYGTASQEEPALLMVFNFFFTGGDYNGSSLTVLGRNPVLNPVREMAVIGGTGVFRLARGFVTAKTYSFNSTTLDAIVEYNVAAIHYWRDEE